MWHESSVAQLATALQARKVDPLTLFAHFWNRIEQGPRSVWILLDRDHAQAQVQASQQRWEAGQPLGPLDGLPVAVKDLIDVAGQPTTAGSWTRRHVAAAEQDAAIVQRLRAQGAILMGKTNLSEFAFSGLGINPSFGTPAQKEGSALARAPGGSSSGSAMALANGMVTLALGTDTSGSMRIPCAWNGLVGLRASQGRYPTQGIFPLSPTLDVPGPLARSVADLVLLDAVMAGEPLAPLSYESSGIRSKPRLWVAEGRWLQELDPGVEQAFEAALHCLQQAGWTVVRRPQPAMEAAMDLQAREGMLVSTEAAQVHAELLGDPQALALVHLPVRLRLEQAATLPAGAEARLLRARKALCAEWIDEVGENTLVVIPTTAGTAPVLAPLLIDATAFAEANMRALRNTLPTAFLNAPSISLPLLRPGLSPGSQPDLGIQFSTIAGRDKTLLYWAAYLESTLSQALSERAERR